MSAFTSYNPLGIMRLIKFRLFRLFRFKPEPKQRGFMDQVSVAKSEFRIKRKRCMNIQKRFIIHMITRNCSDFFFPVNV